MATDLCQFPSSDLFTECTFTPGSYANTSGIYRPLRADSIRLLSFLPEKVKGDVRCEMHEFQLHDDLEYIALSYTWGSGCTDCPIMLNGHRVLIGKNLWRFLLQAQKLNLGLNGNGRFWIDALCIDQPNRIERTQQVSLIPRIFRTAPRVLLWLGPAYGGSEEAMDALSRQARRKVSNLSWKPEGRSLAVLSSRPYWSRLWVFQEIMLAQNITLMCGDRHVPWSAFLRIFHDSKLRQPCLASSNTNIQSAPKSKPLYSSIEARLIQESPAATMISQTHHEPATLVLYDLMRLSEDLQCKEPHDRVYALLGLACQGGEEIMPDYETPLPILLNRVLRNHHRVVPPKSLTEVQLQCAKLDSIMGLESKGIFELVDWSQCFSEPQDVFLASCPPDSSTNALSMWWATLYRHQSVIGLFTVGEAAYIRSWLRIAAGKGHESVVRWLCTIFKPIMSDRQSALTLAAAHGHTKVVQFLLDAQVPVNESMLFDPLRSGHYSVVKSLINAGVLPTNKHLSTVIRCRDEGMAKLLINAGVAPTTDDLAAAFHCGGPRMSNLLIDACHGHAWS